MNGLKQLVPLICPWKKSAGLANIALVSMLIFFVILAISAINYYLNIDPYADLDKIALMEQELGIADDILLSSAKIKHLLFLHKYATKVDKKFAEDSLVIAKISMREEGSLFAREQYEDAAATYPTPDLILAIADGFIRTAQYRIDPANPDLLMPMNDKDLRGYFRGAAHYYRLALEFSVKIDEPFPRGKIIGIIEALKCIDMSLNDIRLNVETPCNIVGDY